MSDPELAGLLLRERARAIPGRECAPRGGRVRTRQVISLTTTAVIENRVAAVLIVIRTGQAEPTMGLDPLLKGVVAAIIGGLGSLGGAVLGGFALGLTEVAFRAWLPPDLSGLTDGLVFFAIALLFIFRPQGLVSVRRAERV